MISPTFFVALRRSFFHLGSGGWLVYGSALFSAFAISQFCSSSTHTLIDRFLSWFAALPVFGGLGYFFILHVQHFIALVALLPVFVYLFASDRPGKVETTFLYILFALYFHATPLVWLGISVSLFVFLRLRGAGPPGSNYRAIWVALAVAFVYWLSTWGHPLNEFWTIDGAHAPPGYAAVARNDSAIGRVPSTLARPVFMSPDWSKSASTDRAPEERVVRVPGANGVPAGSSTVANSGVGSAVSGAATATGSTHTNGARSTTTAAGSATNTARSKANTGPQPSTTRAPSTTARPAAPRAAPAVTSGPVTTAAPARG